MNGFHRSRVEWAQIVPFWCEKRQVPLLPAIHSFPLHIYQIKWSKSICDSFLVWWFPILRLLLLLLTNDCAETSSMKKRTQTDTWIKVRNQWTKWKKGCGDVPVWIAEISTKCGKLFFKCVQQKEVIYNRLNGKVVSSIIDDSMAKQKDSLCCAVRINICWGFHKVTTTSWVSNV